MTLETQALDPFFFCNRMYLYLNKGEISELRAESREGDRPSVAALTHSAHYTVNQEPLRGKTRKRGTRRRIY